MVFKLFFFFFIVFFLELSIRSESCTFSMCGSQVIDFPFQLTNKPNGHRCGYPGFDLSCNNQSQTIITFPSSGDFSVKLHDSWQTIELSDPDGCLPKRLLKGFDPSGTPFQQIYLVNFTLFNCSAEVETRIDLPVTKVYCLSGEKNTVVAVPVDRPDLIATYFSSCLKIGTVSLSVTESNKGFECLFDDGGIWLTWKEPNCSWCVRNGGTCRFKKKKGLEVGCSLDQGFPEVLAKYFILFIVVLLLSILGFMFCISSMIKRCIPNRRHPNTEISGSIRSAVERKGLDDQTIQMYPTMLLGESRQLPKPDDTTCSICLVEYQAKDTLKSIPSCLHYFHASCIDKWLKRNATCPLCRD